MEVAIIDKKKAKKSMCSPTLKVFFLGFCKMYPLQISVMQYIIPRTYEWPRIEPFFPSVVSKVSQAS